MKIWTRFKDWAVTSNSFQLTKNHQQNRRFIRDYQFPVGVRIRFARDHPQLSLTQRDEVFRALQQYFIVCYNLNGSMAPMPSKIVDDAWHTFILFTREYSDFCRRAFGRYLHHTPAEAMSTPAKATSNMQRTWHVACRVEDINPLHPSRLPLLFAIDASLNIANGLTYNLDSMTKRQISNSKNDRSNGSDCGSGGSSDADSSNCGDGSDGCGDGGSTCGGASCGGSACGGSGCGGGCGGD